MTLHLRGSVGIGELTLELAVDLEPHERLALVGPNGAGKTSTLHLLAGLVALDEGEIVVDGVVWDRPADHRWVAPADRNVGVVFQDHRLFDHLSVQSNVAFGPRSRGVGRGRADEQAAAWLARTGLADRCHDRPTDLSGGQRQRAALARALAAGADMLLLDEPFAAADAAVRPGLRALVAEIEPRYLVMAAHDAADLRELADRVLVFGPDRVEEDSPQDPTTPFLRDLLYR